MVEEHIHEQALETIEVLRKTLENHKTVMAEAYEELERCSPNAPVVDKLLEQLS